MILKFRNITKSNKQIYNEFLEFHNKKYGKKENIRTVIMFLFILYIIIFNIANSNLKLIVFFILIILTSFFIYKLYYPQKVVERELKSSKIKNKEDILYNFYDRYYEVIKNGRKQKMLYYKLYKIHQDKTNFYFYIDETHAFIISKNGFVKGNLKEFKNFISKKCRFKYKKYDI